MFHRNAAEWIGKAQAEVARTQERLSTGKRILSPADDPVGAAQALTLSQSISVLEGREKSSGEARDRIAETESKVNSARESMQRLLDIAREASSSIRSGEGWRNLAKEAETMAQALMNIGNSKNGSGSYVFSGYSSEKKSFEKVEGVGVVYMGDQGQIRIGTDGIRTNLTGLEVFGRGARTEVAAAVGNSGNVRLAASGGAPNFEVRFAETASGMSVELFDAAGSSIAGPSPWSGERIAFGGSWVSIEGYPKDGDSFRVSTSVPGNVIQDAFDLASLLASGTGSGESWTRLGTLASRLSTGMERLSEKSALLAGESLRAESSAESAGGERVAAQSWLSKISDLDYAKATTELSEGMKILEAAQASYARVASLSLFKFL